ncbi:MULTISPECIES: hypothetical protein [unclassified Gordonia (in: high G+C Gram-positive bacteria)]|uniref:hypothetical protein n=1 Tax=unclassified Gordonia (in: high G+C Gram-positive bacteria) TaxID=2657482 RepID=UPI00071C737D|nr:MULTISPECIES: hypothetical protein [unclassified Gordonia (in: high G+C Gram-positive bacteria)]KSU49006.1 hypothetical protein AS181_24310 [Gordonia sp. SGD-V-85]SCC61120.1 hypothetical protein GA0061091_1473 [Gordonia sp. v-85]
MADIDPKIKPILEHLFGMQTGYVLDFSNRSFSEFVDESVGSDVDNRTIDAGSKANRLRAIWQQEDNHVVAKLNIDLLDHLETKRLLANKPLTSSEEELVAKCRESMQSLAGGSGAGCDRASAADLQFLEKDIAKVDLATLAVAVSFAEVTKQRLEEIDRCLDANAPLAVIFLCGSTLEGLLHEIADKRPADFNQATSARKDSKTNKVRPFRDWSLSDLISVSRELGILGQDVVKFSHSVRDFRNYIHPRQQIQENFMPRIETAKVAHQVLLAAMADIAKLGK